MKVKHILEALHGLDDNEPVMITFFLKSHADEIGEENDEQPLTNDEWSKAVEKYMKDDHIDQICCEGYAEIVRSVINERVKK
jgi:folate-dependent phosphoribosylglycinamide formyltransferase PurN